jgi:hypothetical protein
VVHGKQEGADAAPWGAEVDDAAEVFGGHCVWWMRGGCGVDAGWGGGGCRWRWR